MSGGQARLAVDIGGTFTDFALIDATGRLHTWKTLTTPDDYVRAIAEGLDALLRTSGVRAAEIGAVLHATTLGSNTILERSGARTALLTTRGFRDVLEIRDLRMPRLYDLDWTKPKPLVPRRLRRVVPERIGADGAVVTPLDEAAARAELARLRADGVESLAICLVNAHVDDRHERRLAELAAEALPGVPVSLGSELSPEAGEYPRTSTTVINAYVRPVFETYIRRLEEMLAEAGVTAPLRLMQSNGGLMPADLAARRPLHLIESGPAAGVVGAAAAARALGEPSVITLDIGGTTAKAALVEDGAVLKAVEFQVGGEMLQTERLLSGAGFTLRAPAVDLAEVGAGGGSLVTLDAAGAPKIGPKSAGAAPGPVCYGRGGETLTVTDCNLVLGYLSETSIAGGNLRLSRAAAEAAAEAQLARPLGLDRAQAAQGAFTLAGAAMIQAIRAVTVERGRDPRDFTLFAFGGNGPLFAAAVAGSLGCRRVLAPAHAGVFSAIGLLCARVEIHKSRGFRRLLDPDAIAAARGIASELAEAAAADAPEADGPPELTARMRYVGQSSDLVVALGAAEALTEDGAQDAFRAEHARVFHFNPPADEPIAFTALEVARAASAEPPPPPPALEERRRPATRQDVYFGPARGWVETPAVGRDAIDGAALGPLLIVDADATTLVPPGAVARGGLGGALILELGASP